jgi:hypothetical protein
MKRSNLEVIHGNGSVTVWNHTLGAALTFRDGVITAREGNHSALSQNNIESMTLAAKQDMQNEKRDAA